ncbi:hypothetical protein MTO96_037006, partial [Rhipicephalus appendiculatus]
MAKNDTPGPTGTATPVATSFFVPALAAASLRSPTAFSFDDAGEWLPWLQQFQDYAFATGMHAAPDETRVRTLLYCMGPRARVVLSSLMSDVDAYKSYQEQGRLLHFGRRKQLAFQRTRSSPLSLEASSTLHWNMESQKLPQHKGRLLDGDTEDPRVGQGRVLVLLFSSLVGGLGLLCSIVVLGVLFSTTVQQPEGDAIT